MKRFFLLTFQLWQSGNIKYKTYLNKVTNKFKVHTQMSNDVAILKLFPGINIKTIKAIFDSAKGIVIESFGTGNAPTTSEFFQLINTQITKGKIVLNITQCLQGSAILGSYETSEPFKKHRCYLWKRYDNRSCDYKIDVSFRSTIN